MSSADVLETCASMQEDEALALQAIYEQKFHQSRTPDGERVFQLSIDIDLQKEEDITIIEEQELPPKPSASAQTATVDDVPSSLLRGGTEIRHVLGNGSGKGQRSRGRGRGRARGRGKKAAHILELSRDGPVLEVAEEAKSLTMNDIAASLEEKPIASTSTLHEALPLPRIRERTARLQYLLPVEVLAILPEDYPLERPPRVQLRCRWLSSSLERQLAARLQPLWQNDSCTYLLVDEIQAAIPEILHPPIRFADGFATAPTLFTQLTNHDRLVRHSTFSSESFDCGICLETKKGARCTRLVNCGHVFCIECLFSFMELNIREGLVKNITCPDTTCVNKRTRQLKDGDRQVGSLAGAVSEQEIEAIVGSELRERYTWLVKKQEIEADPTVTYCPREGCNAPVPRETDEAYERLRICPACTYAWCVYCRKTYHGTKSRCIFSQASSIVDRYVNGTEEEKTALQTRYGKTNVVKMVEMYLEEQANAKWLQENSTRCPDCQLDIERSMGCAHMTCGRCQCHFCFRCGSRLSQKDPYLHYSTPGVGCYNRLFDIVPSEAQMNAAVFDAMFA